MPADVDGAITIGIVEGACDGKALSDSGGSLNQESGITVIDEGDGDGIGVDGFVEALVVGVADGCFDALPFQGMGNAEGAVGAGVRSVDASRGSDP